MRSDRRARCRERMRAFAMRHPLLMLFLLYPVVAGATALCGFQLGYGSYLGRGWVIGGLAGMATAAGLTAAFLFSLRHQSLNYAVLAWWVLGLASASAIRLPFPPHPYRGVEAFFDVLHAALLGYAVVTGAVILVWLAGLFLRVLSRVRNLPAPAGRAPAHAESPARLRFTEAEAATWRAGRLIATDGSVTWRSLKGDVTVDLTAACQAALPSAAGSRQPRTTMLTTASGLAEVDVSPRALAALMAALPSKRPAFTR